MRSTVSGGSVISIWLSQVTLCSSEMRLHYKSIFSQAFPAVGPEGVKSPLFVSRSSQSVQVAWGEVSGLNSDSPLTFQLLFRLASEQTAVRYIVNFNIRSPWCITPLYDPIARSTAFWVVLKLRIYLFHKNYSIFWQKIYVRRKMAIYTVGHSCIRNISTKTY